MSELLRQRCAVVYQTLCARLLCSKSVGMIESAFDLCEREDKRCLLKNLPALGDRVCDDEIGNSDTRRLQPLRCR